MSFASYLRPPFPPFPPFPRPPPFLPFPPSLCPSERYNTPTGNALVDATNDDALRTTFEHWHDGYGKYGIKAMWMDESEPDHKDYISGGQWKLAKGLDTEVLPAWTYDWSKGFSDEMRRIGVEEGDFFLLSRSAWAGTPSHGAALWYVHTLEYCFY